MPTRTKNASRGDMAVLVDLLRDHKAVAIGASMGAIYAISTMHGAPNPSPRIATIIEGVEIGGYALFGVNIAKLAKSLYYYIPYVRRIKKVDKKRKAPRRSGPGSPPEGDPEALNRFSAY